MPAMKKPSLQQKFYSYLLSAQQWYLQTPERSLNEAYNAALMIKAIEDEHFNGNKIAPNANYGNSVMVYFQLELKNYLKTVRMRLTEFKASRSIFVNPNSKITKPTKNSLTILEKLRFIDEILAKYSVDENRSALIKNPQIPTNTTITFDNEQNSEINNQIEPKTNEISLLPRSILSTLNKLKLQLEPNSEEEFVDNFRKSKARTLISVRLILLLIIVPFLTQQLSKNLVIGPIIDKLRNPNQTAIFLNYEMEERALVEMQKFEEKIKFEHLISEATGLNIEDLENQKREKVREIAQEYRNESSDAIKNIFADFLSMCAFIWLLIVSKQEIAVLKEFIDTIIYGLSDSAKAFIIILFTDVFVGYHSTHGWEVFLESASRHFGLPENRDFIFMFIATFPVILDAVFKYWIFRYLNRISPSAVATYRNMNE